MALRSALWAAYRDKGAGSDAHMAAVRDIIDWYDANPVSPAV